ncbi:lung adenoma susceptibility protein 2 isoform X2 [Dunckerocampus dactyliophorus]|uniref:lung adenoma susceptibility protein 2 isoform X2 n=1 Tax=Dunckerocampus dactyliophorus TaxID=161453 RepID=UPI002407528B|nr:lung adenoma susceptibility protein 2 isoform X2 [Dunckerocampus dactyliophorus]
MDSTSPGSDVISPESTVTTLLSSSGHLRSSLLMPDHNMTFRYQDKEYDSASAALEAYIADFDKSQNSKSWMGRLLIPQSPLCTPRRPRMSTFRNKSVLRERLTEREVDFLTLPVSSLRHRDNQDRLSMTTDELLSIPRDGSMPITHTTAFIQGSGVLSQSGKSKSHASSRPEGRAGDDLSHSHLSRNSRSCSRCNKEDVPFIRCLTCAHRAGREAEMSASLHLPGSVTGIKADMDHTPVICVPELKYPARIQYCDLREPPPPSEDDSQTSLRNLRLQFAEQISLLASERKNPNSTESLLRGNRLESLIQKADQVVNFLSQSFGATESLADAARIDPVSPVNGEELQVCSSSCCPLLPMGSERAAEGVPEEIHQTHGGSHHGSSISQQPGALEALKQMMFRLQAVEAALQKHQQPPAASASTDWLQGEEAPKRPDSEAEQSLSGGLSLQRALHHLSRLKLLLEKPKGKQDEDEGWHCSLSNERLLCTQQHPH